MSCPVGGSGTEDSGRLPGRVDGLRSGNGRGEVAVDRVLGTTAVLIVIVLALPAVAQVAQSLLPLLLTIFICALLLRTVFR